ncbi:ankyrin repeat-containing domain protein [Podospora conica]|nr:ankyrin repeat-containing domain protein [Schizothecium conicum]
MTPFLVAALGGRLACVQLFLDATQGAVGEEAIDEGPLSGCRALHLAAGVGSALVVRRLLVTLGKETVNAVDDAGRTAMHHACLNGRAGVVRVLMEAGANPATADASGMSAVGLLKNGKQEAIDYLAATGLNPDFHVLDQEERQTAETLLKMIRNVRFEA